MPGAARNTQPDAGASFREAIASWRLRLHTEVKKSSSLPTAMFDACDPMLETRLAETAEALLTHLEEPDAALAADDEPNGEQRLEVVGDDELRSLPRTIAAIAPRPLALDDDLAAEHLGVLVDICCAATGPLQQRAVQRLCQDFGVDAGTDLDALTRRLGRQVPAAAAADASPGSDDDLAATCRRLAAAVALHGLQPPQGGGPP